MYLEERQFVSGERDVLRVSSLICIAMEKFFVGVREVQELRGPSGALGMVSRKFKATSGPVVWAKVTQLPLATASHF